MSGGGDAPFRRVLGSGHAAALGAGRVVERAVRRPGDRRAIRAFRDAGGFPRVYHHHVRKTGGTSLNRAFLGLGGEDPSAVHWRMRGALHAARSNGLVFVAHDVPLLARGDYVYGWHHAPAWSLRLPPDTFTVTVLRDPVSRILSLYRYLVDPRADDDQPFRAGRAELRRASQGFEQFVRSTPREDLLNQLHMFSASFDPHEAAGAVRKCSAWFMTEDFDRGIRDLNARLGIALESRWDRRSGANDDLPSAHGDMLRTLLAPEYELLDLLGHPTADPSGSRASGDQGTDVPRRS